MSAETPHTGSWLCAHHAILRSNAHLTGDQLWTLPDDQIGAWPHLAPGMFAPGLIALLTLE